jgi:glycine/D-amino acid oxidase-like deaminating enzyme/nitrite reductase/ring-hydroxylating ferredoxin subunit
MQSTAKTLPLWLDVTAECADWWRHAAAQRDCDVVVVGAGIAGLSIASNLLREGRQVLVVDRAGIGAGETLRTSAHLASALDDRFTALSRYHGSEGARLAADSHAAAIDWIERLVTEAGEDCGFRRVPGILFAHDGETGTLEREKVAAAKSGLEVAFLREGLPAMPALGPVLCFARQARIDIGRYLRLLARSVRDRGAQFLRAEAVAVKGGGRPAVELRGGDTLHARQVVVAANVPFHDTGATYLKQAPYRTYVVVGWAPADSIPDALYWDDADPYHYVRLVEAPAGQEGIGLIVGGEDHKVGQDDDPEAYARLQAWTRQRFPSVERFTHGWSGQVLEPADGLGFIGADPDHDNVFIATGDSGNGLTHGTLAGLLVCDLMQGRDNPWAELYDPARRRWAATAAALKENANAAAQFRDWVAPSDLRDLSELSAGNGAVVRRGVHRVAVYRDGGGALHAHNARCPHMGCVVRWSGEEKSWDCPCHGSRFEAKTGAILNGPASEPLAPFDLDETADEPA